MWISVYITILVLIFALIFWFRNYLKDLRLLEVSVGLMSLLGGIFCASLLLWFIHFINLDQFSFYSSVIGPLVEELAKFFVIYFILIFFKKEFKNPLWGLAIGVLVWLGFWFYENLIYINYGTQDIRIILFRSILVWWIMLHPLISGVLWYMTFISMNIPNYFSKVFKKNKRKFNSIYSIRSLLNYVYINSGRSLLILLDCIRRILTLDFTVKYILEWKKNIVSQHWDWPVEIVYEWLFFTIWIHVLYNSLLVSLNSPSLFLSIIVVLITLFLFKFFKEIFGSFYIALFIFLMICLGACLHNNVWNRILMLDLFMLMIVLVLFSVMMEKRMNQ